MTIVRDPAVAGQFYPEDADQLTAAVTTLLEETEERSAVAPKALIVPHAGYIYSGPVAATAYAQLRPFRDRYRRVVLLGPCHRVPVDGMATSGADVFRTPLGDVPLDRQARVVHLPFLQSVLGDFSIVPIVAGEAEAQLVADVLDALWDGPETLVVVSSDLSHYLDYEHAKAIDAVTCRAIENFDLSITHDAACGATPIRGLLLAAERHGLDVRTLDMRNSGDTSGDQDFVVGYGAWVFS
jgi:predicted class III extradiol MEMO1 family dioxygenase